MLETRFFLGVAMGAALMFLAGCNSDSGTRSGGGGGHAASSSQSDQQGQDALDGIVAIKSVDRAADGSVRYVVRNRSGRDQEDLAYFVQFFYEAGPETVIKQLGDSETTQQRDLVLVRDAELEIKAANPRPGKTSLGTKLYVLNNEAVAITAKSADSPGSLVLNKALECVGMSPEEEIYSGPKRAWLEFENVSSRPVSDLEAKIEFHDNGGGNKKIAETKWMSLKTIQPGQRGRVDFDVSTLPRLTNTFFLVKIRQQSL